MEYPYIYVDSCRGFVGCHLKDTSYGPVATHVLFCSGWWRSCSRLKTSIKAEDQEMKRWVTEGVGAWCGSCAVDQRVLVLIPSGYVEKLHISAQCTNRAVCFDVEWCFPCCWHRSTDQCELQLHWEHMIECPIIIYVVPDIRSRCPILLAVYSDLWSKFVIWADGANDIFTHKVSSW